jgi:hypothetical protein
MNYMRLSTSNSEHIADDLISKGACLPPRTLTLPEDIFLLTSQLPLILCDTATMFQKMFDCEERSSKDTQEKENSFAPFDFRM